jgi:group I intron endonuclease
VAKLNPDSLHVIGVFYLINMQVIYSITNKNNSKVYIGSTSNFDARKAQHLSMIKAGSHQNKNLNKDLIDFDSSCFTINVLSSFDNIPKKWLLYLESTWIDYIGYHFKIYNINFNTTSFGKQKFEFDNRNEKLEYRKLRKLEVFKINEIVKALIESNNIYQPKSIEVF